MSSPANINEEMESIIIKEKTKTSTTMDSILPPSDRHAAWWICFDGPKELHLAVQCFFQVVYNGCAVF